MWRIVANCIDNIDAPWLVLVCDHKPVMRRLVWSQGSLYRVMSYRKVSE